jgi:pimeloyl-ACP methyl ester carboxylesterase
MHTALFAPLAVLATTAALAIPAPIQAVSTANHNATSLAWGACPDPDVPRDPRTECATLRVPRDYRQPDGPQITITISRIPAADPALRRGILLSNPGGPGGPGLDLPQFLLTVLPPQVLARYDLIGFDPRGVGASTPISCGITIGDLPELFKLFELVLPYPAPDGSIERNIEFARTTADGCVAHTGDLLPHITTANTARDMDRIRAALGESKLSYLGYSYGTYLGAVYLSLFPQRGDRILLDSAVDPQRIWHETWRQFGPAVEVRLRDFTTWVARRNDTYGLGTTPEEVRGNYSRMTAELDRDPLELPDFGIVLTGNLMREFTRRDLYDDRSFPGMAERWAAVGGATGISTGTAALLSFEPPPPDNDIAVLLAISCNDIAWSREVDRYARNVAIDRRLFPATAGAPGNIWPCAFWPTRPVEPPVRVTDDGPRNILILQNLRDPATPWWTGYGLRTALGQRAAFVTVDAGGHTIYGNRSGACTDAIANTFLTNGVLPGHDQFCKGPSPEDVTPQISQAPGFRPGRWLS